MDHTRNPGSPFRRGAWGRSLWPVLSIPLLLPDGGNVFPARYELVFLGWLASFFFSLLVGVVMLPILLQHIEVSGPSANTERRTYCASGNAEVAIVQIQKWRERLAKIPEENIDNQLLTEVASRHW
ncbi:hypothetical protein [Klebsiella pneumoniae]|uniref:hypothetical protein n=1 Tax=Klebsiella pneumoniae TaxID=573 RepID=UPI003D358389